jgi:tetratricopeptide (TPR) repeat protein
MKAKSFFRLAVIIVMILPALSCLKKGDKDKDNLLPEDDILLTRSEYINVRDSVQWLRFVAQSPDDTTLAYIMMGAVYLKNEMPKQALWYFEIARRLEPMRPIVRLNLASAFNMLEHYDSAEVQLREFADLDPHNPLDEEAFRIVEKYRSLRSEPYIPERYKNGAQSFDGVSDSSASDL